LLLYINCTSRETLTVQCYKIPIYNCLRIAMSTFGFLCNTLSRTTCCLQITNNPKNCISIFIHHHCIFYLNIIICVTLPQTISVSCFQSLSSHHFIYYRVITFSEISTISIFIIISYIFILLYLIIMQHSYSQTAQYKPLN
jgi:hypothetical protein